MRKQGFLKHSTISIFVFSLLHITLALDYPSFNGFFSFPQPYLILLGYQILDLTSKDLDSFSLETQKWTVTGLIGTAKSSECGINNPLLGGSGVFSPNIGMSKTYSALPTHTAIYYQITFNFIDQFKNPDFFTLTLDSTSVAGGSSLKTYNSYVTSNLCGGSDPDTTQFTITGFMPHTTKTLAFQLVGKFATGTGSGTLGIRDIKLTFVNDSSVTTASSCFRVFDSQLLSIPGECSCVKGSYLDSGACATCNSACQNCFGPSASQCFACAFGYSFTGSQCIQCDSSCLTCSGSDPLQCVTCKDGYWLQPDGSCTTTCSLPTSVSQAIGSLWLCYAACTASQYLLLDGSCVNDCSLPMVKSQSISGGYQLCKEPCEDNQYLYSDGSCSSECPNPLVSADGIKRCSPDEALSSDDKNSVDKATDTADVAGNVAKAGIAASSLISSHGSGAITLISLIKMLEYIRYMKINYPPKLEYMMDLQNGDQISFNLNVNLPASIERKFPDYTLPGKFGEYGLASNFFVNYWQELLTSGILLIVLAITAVLASKAQHIKYIGTYSVKLRDIIKWNLSLIVFCGNIDSVGVFSSMEFRTTHFNSFTSVFATLICITINLLVLYLMLLIPYIIYSLRRKSTKVFPLTNEIPQPQEENRFMSCGVLFMNFKEKSVLQHSCMFFILFRVYLFNITIGYFFDYPLAQAIFLTIMSVLMLGYFITTRPYKNTLELIKTLSYEVIIAVVNLCVLILAIMDHRGIENQESRVKLGDAIIISNIAFNLTAVFYMVVEFVIKVIKVYERRKTITSKGWRYWLTIITFLLEPEELEMEGDDKILKKEDQAKAPKKSVTFKCETPSNDQLAQDSDIPPLENISPANISTPASRSSFNKVGILKSNSVLSLDGFNDFGSKNLLTPANARPSIMFSQETLSPRGSLLRNLENLSATPSPRMLLRGSNQPSFQDLLNKFGNESLTAGVPTKLDDEKGEFLRKVKSNEFNPGQNRDKRRNTRFSGTGSILLDNSGSSPEVSIEVGSGTGSAVNTPRRQQSIFSKYSPEKSKVLSEEEA